MGAAYAAGAGDFNRSRGRSVRSTRRPVVITWMAPLHTASRRVVMGARAWVTEHGFYHDGRAMFAIDVENGIRVWSLPATTSTTGRIKNGATSTVFVDLVGDDTILVRDRLACVLWSKAR